MPASVRSFTGTLPHQRRSARLFRGAVPPWASARARHCSGRPSARRWGGCALPAEPPAAGLRCLAPEPACDRAGRPALLLPVSCADRDLRPRPCGPRQSGVDRTHGSSLGVDSGAGAVPDVWSDVRGGEVEGEAPGGGGPAAAQGHELDVLPLGQFAVHVGGLTAVADVRADGLGPGGTRARAVSFWAREGLWRSSRVGVGAVSCGAWAGPARG